MIRPDDVTDAMVDAAFGDLLDGTGNANWASRPNREIMRGALARAINASGCVLVPREPTEAMVNAGLKAADDAAFCFIGSAIKYESTRPHLARLAYKAMLAAADPREQALDRMAENAQELGLYDEPGKEGDK